VLSHCCFCKNHELDSRKASDICDTEDFYIACNNNLNSTRSRCENATVMTWVEPKRQRLRRARSAEGHIA
jgi:hypothetical protein